METLYHYCSSSTFLSILRKKAIQLSSLSLSNDLMEGKVLSDVFSRIIEKDSFDDESATLLRNVLCIMERFFDGLGFCLSEVGDLLSQWRGYAQDGQGFCIGFSKKYLEDLSKNQRVSILEESRFVLRKVIYDKLEQERALTPIYHKIKEMSDAGKLKFPRPPGLLTRCLSETSEEDYEQRKNEYFNNSLKVFFEIFPSLDNLFVFKNEAFSEEKEWRLVSFLLREKDDDCLFHASNNRLIPYRTFDLLPLDIQPITEIIIGPKNITPLFVVEKLLNQQDLNKVPIRRSSATYR